MTETAPNNLARIIRNIDDLPTLPSAVMKITELANNPKASARDLAGVISEDQILTARLLKLVNSAFYGFPQKITTVTGAVVLLGFDAIRNLLLTTSVFDMFSGKTRKDKFDREQLWNHSLGCAVGAKIIGNYIRYDKIEELFVFGLLHDIGKIVEMLFMPNYFDRITSIVKTENILIYNAESQVLGYTHSEVGTMLAKKWKLSSKLAGVIAHHHKPENADKFLIETAVIHLSDILCRALDIGSGGDNKIPPLNKTAWDILQIKTNALEPIMYEIENEFKDISLFTASAL